MNGVKLLKRTSRIWRHLLPLKCWWAPRIVYIEPTNACNLKCTMCPQSSSQQQRGFMEFSLFRKVVDEVPRSSHIHLYYRGEPTLHPQIAEMTSYAGLHHKVTLSTNGTHSLDGIKTTLVKFSFDGVDRESYESIRRGGNYDDVIRNIARAVSSRAFGEVLVEAIETPENGHLLKGLSRQMYSLGVDKVCIKRYLHWSAPCKNSSRGSKPCILPWHSLGVYQSGTVTPCCVDYEGALTIGNAGSTSIMELWNNQEMVDLRRRLRSLAYTCDDSDTLFQPYQVMRK